MPARRPSSIWRDPTTDQAAARDRAIAGADQQAEAALADADYQLSQRRSLSQTEGRVQDIYFRDGEYVPAVDAGAVGAAARTMSMCASSCRRRSSARCIWARRCASPATARKTIDAHHHLHRAAGGIHPAGDLQRRQSREAGVQAGSARARRAEAQSRPAGGSAAAADMADAISPSMCKD